MTVLKPTLAQTLAAIETAFGPIPVASFTPIRRGGLSGRFKPHTVTCPDCGGRGGEDMNPSRAKYDNRHNEEYAGDWQDCGRCDGTGEVEPQEDE